jgi:MraZ protein
VQELYGEHFYQLDPKGRISLPGKYRGALGDGAVITLGVGGCLAVYPMDEWGRKGTEVRDQTARAQGNPAYATVLFSNAEQVELDKQGRVVVPTRLRSKAGLTKDVAVLGVGDHLQIWDAQTYRRQAEVWEAQFVAGGLKAAERGGEDR